MCYEGCPYETESGQCKNGINGPFVCEEEEEYPVCSNCNKTPFLSGECGDCPICEEEEEVENGLD